MRRSVTRLLMLCSMSALMLSCKTGSTDSTSANGWCPATLDGVWTGTAGTTQESVTLYLWQNGDKVRGLLAQGGGYHQLYGEVEDGAFTLDVNREANDAGTGITCDPTALFYGTEGCWNQDLWQLRQDCRTMTGQGKSCEDCKYGGTYAISLDLESSEGE